MLALQKARTRSAFRSQGRRVVGCAVLRMTETTVMFRKMHSGMMILSVPVAFGTSGDATLHAQTALAYGLWLVRLRLKTSHRLLIPPTPGLHLKSRQQAARWAAHNTHTSLHGLLTQ